VGFRDASSGGAIFWFELPRTGGAEGRPAPHASA
jgi:hypothetical protein